MGDRRFEGAYLRVVESRDRAATIQDMTDREVIHALAAASQRMDAYLANVLATVALDRQNRREARFGGLAVGAGVIIGLRSIFILWEVAQPESMISHYLWLTTTASAFVGVLAGVITHRALRARPL